MRIEPEELCDGVVLYEGDCLDVLPHLQGIDAIVTDPPYGLGDLWNGGGGSSKSSWSFRPEQAKSWDGETVDSAVAILESMNVPSIIWGGNNYRLSPSRCWFVWDKKVNDAFTTGQAELAWTNIDRTTRVFRLSQVEAHNEMGDKEHPTQKPVSLIRWCFRMAKIPIGSVILDPFAGSGTCGVSSAIEGRKCILIERDPAYCDIIRKRVRAAAGIGSLFDPSLLGEDDG